MAAGIRGYFSSGVRPSINAWIFFATTAACAAPGLAALRTPVSAISPTANRFGYLGSWNCIVGRILMKPLSGFIIGADVDGGKSLTRPLLGVWPVAMITKSVLSSLPLVNWTVNWLPVLGNPFGGIWMRVPVISLFRSAQAFFILVGIEHT